LARAAATGRQLKMAELMIECSSSTAFCGVPAK
jgi:hypothetical protein